MEYNTTSKKINLTVNCTGDQGINYTDIYFGAAPDSSSVSFTLLSIQAALGASSLTVKDFVLQGKLTFEKNVSQVFSAFNFTGLKNAGVNYTLTAFCGLNNVTLTGASKNSSWTQPDNGGKPVTFAAIYNGSVDAHNISKYQALALVQALNLDGNFVFDQFGNKAVVNPNNTYVRKLANVVAATNATTNATANATSNTTSNGISNVATQNVTITTTVLRNYASSEDTASSLVLNAGNSSTNVEFLKAFNAKLEALAPGISAQLQGVSAGSFTPVAPVINFTLASVANNNINVTVSLNTAGTLAVVGDLQNNTVSNTYSAKSVFLGTNDKGNATKFKAVKVLDAAGNVTFSFVADVVNTTYTFYLAGQNGIGEFQAYTSVINVDVKIAATSFGWRFGVMVLAVLGLIFFN